MSALSSIIVAVLIALGLSVHGLRRRSLSSSGAATAFIVGFCMMAAPLKAFGVSLIVFYLVGSRATKYGKQRKAKLEDGYHEAGYRSGWQVFCNSLSAFVACIIWSSLYWPNSPLPDLLGLDGHSSVVVPYVSSAWCPLSKDVGQGWSRALMFAMLGHFACCLGDTLASELGILSRSPPILITTLKTVPPGTNGGVSLVGTMASVAGGSVMGITVAACVVIENLKCREDWLRIFTSQALWGTVAGFAGSLIDSLLGATVQRSRYSQDLKVILSDDSSPEKAKDAKVVSGLNILTNNQVNLLSSVLTSVLVASLSLYL